MLRVGLTGGIGAGKSTVAARLEQLGARIVDADRLARDVVEPGTPGLAAIVRAFGARMLDARGALDRAALGALVFADEAARLRLNAIVHPLVGERTAELFAQAPPDAVLVNDVPLLVENRLAAGYHLVIVVHTPAEERAERLVQQRGMDREEAWRRIRAQAGDQARRAVADVWLDNTGAPPTLVAAVDRLWFDRLLPFEHNLRNRTPAAIPPVLPVVAARPDWPAEAARLRARLLAAAGPEVLRIDHVGPTAVPAAPAPDVIDLRLLVADAGTAARLREPLAGAGFAPLSQPDPHGPLANCDPGRLATLHVKPGLQG